MFYKLTFDMDLIDKTIEKGNNYIYAETTNMDSIIYPEVKEGFFDNIILSNRTIEEWPNVEFYYSSKVSKRECDYLLNVKRWPIVHIRVKETLLKNNIMGIKFYPIKLVDVVTEDINTDYYLMYIENFIDAFDMERSQYRYNEKYNLYTFIPKHTYLNVAICSCYDIFRCEKSVAGIYVSDKFYNIITDNKFTGFAFEEQM